MPRAGCPVADVDLTIPATRELLDGWCGPIQVETRALGWLPGVVVDGWAYLTAQCAEVACAW